MVITAMACPRTSDLPSGRTEVSSVVLAPINAQGWRTKRNPGIITVKRERMTPGLLIHSIG